MKFLRLLQTIRHLKPLQIYRRPIFAIGRRFFPPAGAGDESISARDIKRLYPLIGLSELSFNFLNRPEQIDTQNMIWQSKQWPTETVPERLWFYNLNYFTWLFSDLPEHKMDQKTQLYLILDWIEKNVSARSETWEPYVISKRLISWIKWLDTHKALVEPVRDCIKKSLFSQLKRLARDIEYHNLANHLFENLTAMFVTSIFLLKENSAMQGTLTFFAKKALEELQLQIAEQFFPDGGHYERSPMYHHEMLNDISLLKDTAASALKLQIFEQSVVLTEGIEDLLEQCNELEPLARDWLANLTHPDGKIAQFNDCTLSKGIDIKQKQLPKATNYLLKSSGFFVRRDSNIYFALSCKEPSPSFQPGHTHCDILSYELSLKGLRCIIDTGCGSYQNMPIRQHCRSTSSHNVPQIELAEQSDIWSAFRIGKRAEITRREFDSEKGLLTVEFIDQYGQTFRREIIFAECSLKIRDRMFNRRINGTFCSNIHLHPEILLLPSEAPGLIRLARPGMQFSIRTNSSFRTVPHEWYPDFGKAVKTVKLILSNHETEAMDYVISW